MRKLAAMAATAAFVFATVAGRAVAEPGPQWGAPGIYGAVLGTATWALSDDKISNDLAAYVPTAIPGTLDIEEIMGFSVRLGMRAHQYVAAEVQFDAFIGGFSGSFTNAPGGPVGVFTDRVTYDTFVCTANFKGFPLKYRWQPYVQVGPGFLVADGTTKGGVDAQSEVGFALRFGAGVEYNLSENWAATVGADYVLPFGKVNDFDYVTVNFGLQYTFRLGDR